MPKYREYDKILGSFKRRRQVMNRYFLTNFLNNYFWDYAVGIFLLPDNLK